MKYKIVSEKKGEKIDTSVFMDDKNGQYFNVGEYALGLTLMDCMFGEDIRLNELLLTQRDLTKLTTEGVY